VSNVLLYSTITLVLVSSTFSRLPSAAATFPHKAGLRRSYRKPGNLGRCGVYGSKSRDKDGSRRTRVDGQSAAERTLLILGWPVYDGIHSSALAPASARTRLSSAASSRAVPE